MSCIALALLLVSSAAVGQPRLDVRCLPARALRGTQVACTASVVPPQTALLVERLAVAGGHTLRDDSEVKLEPGALFTWAGAAVVPTTVVVRAVAAGQSLRGEASFTVAAREWPALALRPLPPPQLEQNAGWEYGPDALFGGWPPAVREAGAQGTDRAGDRILADGSLGIFRLTLASPPTQYVSEGPNARWFYVAEPAPAPVARVFLSRALRPGDPFYEAQQGGAGDGLRERGCGFHDLEVLRTGVLQHEGAVAGPQPSHRSESLRRLEEEALQRKLEELTLFLDDAMDGPPLSTRIDTRIRDFLASLTAGQRLSVDQRAPVRLSCRLREVR